MGGWPLKDKAFRPAPPNQPDNMNQKVIKLFQRYATALEKHLKQGPQASLQPARGLGRAAVALGLETLELAKIHELSLATLQLSQVKNAFTKLAGIFFTEANTLIEETHHTARQTKAHLNRVMATLGRRTAELAASNHQLKQRGVQHKVMEDGFEKRGQRQQKCLEESLELQKRLRQLTHQVIAAQEDERRKISLELQDEIAQTLLGINVRLLTLKQGDQNNTKSLKNEIASTQRLVVKSARTVRRYAHKLEVHQPA